MQTYETHADNSPKTSDNPVDKAGETENTPHNSQPHNGREGTYQQTCQPDASLVRFFGERGRRAARNGRSMDVSPFFAASLSPFGKQCAEAWEREYLAEARKLGMLA